MGEFEWVGEQFAESYQEEIESQVNQYERLQSKAILYVELMGTFIGLFGVLTIAQYVFNIFSQPSTKYSININDALVTQRSADALSFSGVSLDFRMGFPNKILALFVGAIAVALLVEFIFNAYRVYRFPINRPVDESLDYRTLKRWKNENHVILLKSEYLLKGMQNKAKLFLLPGVLSIYVLGVLTGHAIFADEVNPAYQIIIVDLIIIAFIAVSLLYLAWMLTSILTESMLPAAQSEDDSLTDSLRPYIRSEYNGVFGALSALAVFLTLEFIIYSGLLWHLWQIFRLWLYVHSGPG